MQLIMEALDAMMHRREFCSVDGHDSLSRKIVALHLIHDQWCTEVMQFSQLVLNRPGILHSLSIMNPLARAGKEVCDPKVIMPQCACASEVYGSVCVGASVRVCVVRLLHLLKDQ